MKSSLLVRMDVVIYIIKKTFILAKDLLSEDEIFSDTPLKMRFLSNYNLKN